MRLPIYLRDLKSAPTEVLRREVQRRIEGKYVEHCIGEKYPKTSVNDWALVAELALRATDKGES